MTAKQIFSRTMPFVWAKLILGLALVLACGILFAILMLIAALFNNGAISTILIIIWIAAAGVLRFAIMHYFGYLVKAGHIAVIAQAVTTGRIPSNQVEYGKQAVTKRFTTANVYFAVDKLVTSAVKQIQNTVQRASNALDFIPGIKSAAGLVNFFISIYLGYIDECCLGYTFYKDDQNAYKSAADGVVIYAQNWKPLLKDAAKTSGLVALAFVVVALVVFALLGILFRVLNQSTIVAFILACFVAWAVKFAFIDSYILARVMNSYMNLAPNTQITFDLYDKLCKVSSSLKELLGKGGATRQSPAPAQSAVDYASERYDSQAPVANAPETTYCPQCGAQNEPGARFCAECGKSVRDNSTNINTGA